MQITSVRDLSIQVKERRKELGWTQAQLAENAGVSRDWIMALEKAKPSIELALVLRTLKALSIQLQTDDEFYSPTKTTIREKGEKLIYTGSSIEGAKAAIRKHAKKRKESNDGNA